MFLCDVRLIASVERRYWSRMNAAKRSEPFKKATKVSTAVSGVVWGGSIMCFTPHFLLLYMFNDVVQVFPVCPCI